MGNEYFLVTGSNQSDNLITVLKAFSVFKKMQKSNMLLLILSPKNMDTAFLQKLESFKYKNEVRIVQVDKYKAGHITAASYAFLQPFQGEEYSNALQAMKCNVPVIAGDKEVTGEVCGDAAIYTDPRDHKQVADKMMLLYKDENLRSSLIEKGKQQVAKYSWDVTAKAFWRSIEKTGE
jgi:glycosyltransferase involved in cell wall biosynthesis